MKHRWLRSLSRLGRDECGAVLVYVSLMLPVLVGFGVLAVDAARLSNLATSLQKGADALALAGAAELDRKPDAITRATKAINELVANQHKFAVADSAKIVPRAGDGDQRGIIFLKELPADTQAIVPATHEASGPEEARFVKVTVVPQDFSTILPASFIGGSNTAQASASAVAGFDAAVCQFTPMFMCNPYENDPDVESIFEAIKDPEFRRRQIKLRMKGGGSSQYAPGNYGFLHSPTGGQSAKELRELLGMTRPPACFVQNGVKLRPGVVGSARQGVNVRFDLYEGSMDKNDPEYRPALNVRKGYKNCNQEGGDASKYLGLPDDTCFISGSCAEARFGDGNWDIDQYKMVNQLSSLPFSNSNRTSRYEVYRYEIENGLVNQESLGGESGKPNCYNKNIELSDNPDRRFLYMAVLNCEKHKVSEENNGNSGKPVPVEAFVKVFLTRPVKPPEDDIVGEIVDIVEPGTVSNEVARDLVQLYR